MNTNEQRSTLLAEESEWIPTAKCCERIGISRDTLRRLRRDGKLKPGIHFRSIGLCANSSIQWNYTAITKAMILWTRNRYKAD
jgi:hypothetical protein